MVRNVCVAGFFVMARVTAVMEVMRKGALQMTVPDLATGCARMVASAWGMLASVMAIVHVTTGVTSHLRPVSRVKFGKINIQ